MNEKHTDLEIEKAVLGTVIMSIKSLYAIVDVLNTDFFSRQIHVIIYRKILEMEQDGSTVDLLSLNNALAAEKSVTSAYLAELCEHDVLDENHLKRHVIILKELYNKRVLSSLFKRSTDKLLANEDVEVVSADVQAAFLEINNPKKQSLPIATALSDEFRALEKTEETGIKTGILTLDNPLKGGFKPGQLVVLAGRPATGKTALMLNFAANTAIKHDNGVGLFSLEMSTSEIVKRFMALKSGLQTNNFQPGRLSNDFWDKIYKETADLADANLHINDTGVIGLLELKNECMRLKLKHNVNLVCIDYLQLLIADKNASKRGREQEIASLSRGLKLIAKQLDITILCLSQLSRAVEQRADNKPKLSDLRDSGAIEQDADVVMFLYDGNEKTQEQKHESRTVKLYLAKNRNGATTTIDLSFKPEICFFGEQTALVAPF